MNETKVISEMKFLNRNEMKLLLDYTPVSQRERQVLDNFLFGCLTGLKYNEYHDLRKSDIKEQKFSGDSVTYLAAHVKFVKTGCISVIPILPAAKEIIERYKDLPGDFVLPHLTNQCINQHIKMIAERAGLNKDQHQFLNTHYGRRSFIGLAVSENIPTDIIAAITCHSINKQDVGSIDKKRFVQLLDAMKF